MCLSQSVDLIAKGSDLLIKITGMGSKIQNAVDSAAGVAGQAYMAKIEHRENCAAKLLVNGTDQGSPYGSKHPFCRVRLRSSKGEHCKITAEKSNPHFISQMGQQLCAVCFHFICCRQGNDAPVLETDFSLFLEDGQLLLKLRNLWSSLIRRVHRIPPIMYVEKSLPVVEDRMNTGRNLLDVQKNSQFTQNI